MKILLVEDNVLDLELARRALEREVPQLALTIVSSVAQALAVLQPGADFDVVLTDLRLPDGSGLDVLNSIRRAGLPHAVVVLTGQGDEETAVGAVKAGADDYVAKRSGYYSRLPHIAQTALARFRQETRRKSGLLRVLYAEHNAVDVELARRHLEQHAPHIKLQVVYSSAEALTHLPDGPEKALAYDVLLLDFNLPGENALELLKLLYDERRLDLPVVLVTGQGDEEVAAKALRLGATDYIVKNSGYLYELPVALENAHFRASLAREGAALLASEERFRRLTDNLPDLVYRYALAPAPRFEYVSSAAKSLTGYTPEDHYQDPQLGYKLTHPEDHHLLDALLQGQWDYRQPLVMRWVRQDGTIIWTEQRNTPIYDAGHRLVALEGIVRDITQLHETTEEMQQHIAEMQALHHVSNALRTAQTEAEAVFILLDQALAALKTNTGAIWLYDEESGNLKRAAASGWCQHAALAVLAPDAGITGTVFVTATAKIVEDMAASPHLLAAIRDHVPEGWTGGWAPIRTSDQVIGVLLVAAERPQTVTPEQIKLVVSLAEMAGSILQRLRLLSQAQAQAELTRQIVNTIPEGVALLEDAGGILLANPPAQRFLDELGEVGAGAVVSHVAGQGLRELLISAQGSWREIQFQGRTFILNAQPVEPDAPDTSWVLVLDEVTAAREQQRYQEAQDRLATVGQLAAGIAHDFNNVLNIISVYADIMQAAPNLSAQQQKQLATVVEQAHHAANLVRQVLDFSRRSVMERMDLDLYPLVNEQIKLLERTLPENIRLQLAADEKSFPVSADPTRLRQVLMNLAINARDAMPDGGALTFALERVVVSANGESAQLPLPDMASGAWVRLSVADTGGGIAPAHLAHIFEPFFTTKPRGQGTGLGLAQVYGIVKQHDGAINVASAPGQGATFAIYLPLKENKPAAKAVAARTQTGGGSECILLVEDNVDLCLALAQSLEMLGYHVLQAFDGTTALRLAAEHPAEVDLVVSDMVMPGWNGIDLYGELRKIQPGAELLIITGHPLTQAHAARLEEQAGSWLQKPFALTELAARVRAMLNAAPARRRH